MTHTLESLRFNYYENTLDAEDFMHIIINLQDELTDLRDDRDSESRWAAQYLSERDEAKKAEQTLEYVGYQYKRERDEARAEVERLKGIIWRAEYSRSYGDDGEKLAGCPICEIGIGNEHEYYCPFYQWEGGEK